MRNLVHRRGAEEAEEARRMAEYSFLPLRRLCVLCASAVNEHSLGERW
jgi:hypothetical protein